MYDDVWPIVKPLVTQSVGVDTMSRRDEDVIIDIEHWCARPCYCLHYVVFSNVCCFVAWAAPSTSGAPRTKKKSTSRMLLNVRAFSQPASGRHADVKKMFLTISVRSDSVVVL